MLNNNTVSRDKDQSMLGYIKKSLKEVLPIFIVTFVFCFMLFVYEPIFMYATNMNDFWFDFGIMIKPTIKIFALFFFVCIFVSLLIYCLCKMLGNRMWIFNGIVLLLFIILFVTYIQGNWLVGSLPGLDGTEINWISLGKKEDLFAGLLFMALGIAVILLIVKFHSERLVKWCSAVSVIVLVMLLSSLASVVLSNDALKDKDGINLTMNNFNTISENKNFLIFLVDSVDSEKFEEVLNGDPEYNGVFDDFTFFTDNMSAFPFTQFSIPFILSGNISKNEEEFSEYSSEAYNNSQLFSMLKTEGYDLNLYSPSIVWNGTRQYEVSNASSINNANIDYNLYAIEEFKWIKFKYLPYCLKKYSEIETFDFNKCIEKFWWFNPFIYSNIKENSQLQKVEKNTFQFIHADGGHIPFVYDKDVNWISGGTYYTQLESCITMINAYLQRLKDNGVYDNSVIIIMADHGYIEHDTDLILTQEDPIILDRYNSLLLIKGFNEKHELLKSDLPVSHFDLIDVYSDLLSGKKSTDLFSDITAPRIRKLICYTWEQDNHLVEYETDSTARDWESFRETGNVYDR